MKSYLAILIVAVTVNCLVTTINGTPVSNTLTIPFTDMLLPPLEDVQGNSSDVVSTTKTTTTTQKHLKTGGNNVLPELSTEALLPPLFDSKIEENEEDNKQPTKIRTTTTYTTTTTRKPTTVKPSTTTTTTLKPTIVEVPDLFLDALLPPIQDNTVDSTFNIQFIQTTTATKKPLLDVGIFKTTKKSYYQRQTEHLKDLHLIDQDETHPKTYEKQQQQLKNLQLTSVTRNYNKLKTPSTEKPQQISTSSQHHIHRNIEKLTTNQVVKQVMQQKLKVPNDPRQFNYSFDFYLGSTTARPPKSGLPTITPFPHRLGR